MYGIIIISEGGACVYSSKRAPVQLHSPSLLRNLLRIARWSLR